MSYLLPKTVKERADDIRIVTGPDEDDVVPKNSIKVLPWMMNHSRTYQ